MICWRLFCADARAVRHERLAPEGRSRRTRGFVHMALRNSPLANQDGHQRRPWGTSAEFRETSMADFRSNSAIFHDLGSVLGGSVSTPPDRVSLRMAELLMNSAIVPSTVVTSLARHQLGMLPDIPRFTCNPELLETMVKRSRRCTWVTTSRRRCENVARLGSPFCDRCTAIYSDPKAYDVEESRRSPRRATILRRVVDAISLVLSFMGFPK